MPADALQALLLLLALAALAWPLGCHIAAVFSGRRTRLSFLVEPVERALVAGCGRAAVVPMGWKGYATASVLFGVGATVLVNVAALRGGVMASLAGAAADFAQAMAGLSVWGALARRRTVEPGAHLPGEGLSNFWLDMIRCTLHVGLPLSLLLAIMLVSQGAPQSTWLTATVPLVETVVYEQPVMGENGRPILDAGRPLLRRVEIGEQSIATGPVATDAALRMMRAADAPPVEPVHPFVTPTPLANFARMLWALLMPGALCLALALVSGRRPGAMIALLSVLAVATPLVLMAFSWAEGRGGEFAETRLGEFGSLFWTSGAVQVVYSCGTVPGLARLLAGLILVSGFAGAIRQRVKGRSSGDAKRRDPSQLTRPALAGAVLLVFVSCIPSIEQITNAGAAGTVSGWLVLPAIAAIAFTAGVPAADALLSRWTEMIRAAGVVLAGVALGAGVLVPALVTGVAIALPAVHAQGPTPLREGLFAGPARVGQEFGEPVHFWGRVSATRLHPYRAVADEMGAHDKVDGSWRRRLDTAVGERLKVLALEPGEAGEVPRDLVVPSASGLNPHIGPEAARYQVARIARVREIDETELLALVDRHAVGPQFGLLGAARVNVVALNRDLQGLK